MGQVNCVVMMLARRETRVERALPLYIDKVMNDAVARDRIMVFLSSSG